MVNFIECLKRAVQYSLFSSAISISFISLCICSIVECLFLKPNWWSGISFFLSLLLFLSGNILFFPVFWKILKAVILVCKMQFGAGLFLVYVTFWSVLISMVWGSIEFLELHWILLSLVLLLLAEGFSKFYHWLGRFLVLCCFLFYQLCF